MLLLATNSLARPSRNQIKKPITSTCTSTTTCTYFVDVDVHVLVDGFCHLQRISGTVLRSSKAAINSMKPPMKELGNEKQTVSFIVLGLGTSRRRFSIVSARVQPE